MNSITREAAMAALTAIFVLGSIVQAQFRYPGREEKRPPRVVEAKLVADTTRIEPGSPFNLVVMLEIDEGWRIGWGRNADPAWITTVGVDVPNGFDAAEARFTGPIRWESESGVARYGYESEAAIFISIDAPEDLEPGAEHEFEATVKWIARNEDREGWAKEEHLSITLAVADDEHPAEPDHGVFIRPLAALLPRPLEEASEVGLEWAPPAMRPTLTITAPGAERIEWFPYSHPTTDFIDRKVEVTDHGATLKITFATDMRSAVRRAEAYGLLMIDRDGETQYYEVARHYRLPHEPP